LNVLILLGASILLFFQLLALKQSKDLMRLLVFSAVAEIGYVLMGLGTGVYSGGTGAVLHLEYQLLMRGLVFLAAAALVLEAGSKNILEGKKTHDFSPFLSTVFAFGVFSVMGLSPFKGSISKFLIIYANIETGGYIYAAVCIVGSVIEAWYFIRLIQKICFEKPDQFESSDRFESPDQAEISSATDHQSLSKVPLVMKLGLVLLTVLTALSTLFPEIPIHWSEIIVKTLPLKLGAGEVPVFDSPWSIFVLAPYIGAFVAFISGRISQTLRNVFVAAITAALVYLVWADKGMDSLARLFTIVVVSVTFLAAIYSMAYFKGKENSNRYFFFLMLMLGSMVGVTTSKQLGDFYVFWELMTWSSYLLVVHNQTEKALKAGFKYFMMCASGAFVMLFGILMIYQITGTFDMAVISSAVADISPIVAVVILMMFLIGAGVKIGLVPMHSWLPEAHPEAPSPISALLSGILTKIGIYGLIKIVFVLFGIALISQISSVGKFSGIGFVISVLGVLTLLYGEVMALIQKDVKKLLAYSTLAQLGEIIITLGVGTYLSLAAGLYHIVNHAVMKGLLFLAAGVLIYRVKSQDVSSLRGIGRKMPFTSACFSIGILSIMGLPPFNGFMSKFLMLYANVEAGHWYLVAIILAGSIIGAIYYIRLIRTVFFEKYDGPDVKEGPVGMLVPVGLLTAFNILSGLFPGMVLDVVKSAAGYVANVSMLPITAIPDLSITWPIAVIIAMGGGLLAYFLGKYSKKAAGWTAFLTMVLTIASIFLYMKEIDILTFSFAVLIAFVGALNLLHSIGYMDHSHAQNRYFMFFVIMIGGLLGAAVSRDFFNFFVFWEIMSSWTLYFVIIHEETKESLREGFKYFIFNYAGANLMLIGILLLTASAGTFDMLSLGSVLKNLPISVMGWGTVLIIAGILMKAAVLPFRIDYQMHPATAPTPVSGYISSVLLKSAPFMLMKIFFVIGGVAVLGKLGTVGTTPVIMYAVSWIAGLTIIGAAVMALIQNNIKLMLIYSTVSQIAYIILGLSLGTALGTGGGMLHFVNHMFFKNLLFLSAGAIMVQANVKNLDEAGGLGRKMPLTLLFFTVGALSLAGVPPFNGFSSKWLVYQAAMEKGYVFLAVIAMVASVITLAYFVKFLHSAFFGSLPQRLENVKEAPWTMLLPMGALSGLCLITGVAPGITLQVISRIQVFLGIPEIKFTLFGIYTPLGAWSAGIYTVLIFAALAIGVVLYFLSNRKTRFTDVYTCGVSDLNSAEIRIAAQNMYEVPVAKKTGKRINNVLRSEEVHQ